LPVTDRIASRMLSIPFHSSLTPDELELVAATLEKSVADVRRGRRTATVPASRVPEDARDQAPSLTATPRA
jgi:hypothetical protein